MTAYKLALTTSLRSGDSVACERCLSQRLAPSCTSERCGAHAHTQDHIKQHQANRSRLALACSSKRTFFKLSTCARFFFFLLFPRACLNMSHLDSSPCVSPPAWRDSSNPRFHLDLLHLQREQGGSSCLSLKFEGV